MALSPVVRTVAEAHLAQADASAPGLVEGLYLVGSAAMDDFHAGGRLARWGPSGAGSSDIDFVAVTSEPLSETALATLARVHQRQARRHPRPFFDGMYLTWADLARGPAGLVDHAHVHSGTVRTGAAPSPVTWHELAEFGVTVRGARSSSLTVWTDGDALTDWCRANLEDYWRRWHHRSRSGPSSSGLASLTPFATAWAVLGVSRSHYTASTGHLTSKSGAGHYAREVFDPSWHRIIDEGLRIRTGSSGRPLYRNPCTRRRATLDFVEMVLERGTRST